MPEARFSFFAACPPGLEDITRGELFKLGVNHPQVVPGGVEFGGFLSYLYQVNLWSRTASRVLVRLGTFEAKAFDELERKAAALPWGEFIKANTPVEVRATCHKSKLYHSDAVAERVTNAVASSIGKKISPQSRKEREELREKDSAIAASEEGLKAGIVVRLDHDHCTISLDSSGAHLHQRGYRLATAKAPLRETLAAALLLHAGYEPGQPLLDPFCGSGTFAIEAALIARKIAPGLNRRFGFMDWVNFQAVTWDELVTNARAGELVSAPAPILGSDRDEGAVTAARENAVRAGVAEAIQFSPRAISAIEPPAGPGLVIGNLPYGKRVSSDVANLYAQFGKVMRAKCTGWRVGILAGDTGLLKQTRLPFGEPLWIENGGLKVPFGLTPHL